ncbi:ankyrin repeat domain-containing protein [Pseudomethylobacillus aquaticus]|uniref:Ankyrin repeat domain-containing protein n=1 Tax=Pseudomethylobacillus aquaticus TaxID=2676064 RepID=A0A3N0UYU6_9PROT|nr:ankyrin repeat domain-containing protein [Pseudomethylobacillus aquaticus]ROH85700.1 ankyrin repeat domain-containing protein [Pseudomethylobacillus aquaticus]
MAHLPSFEEILTEVHSRFGLKALPNKGRFTGYELEVDGHVDRLGQLLLGIFDALELDERARRDATHLIEKLAGILKALELRTWTGNANQKQVLWHLLICLHVPVWARNVAFWSLANVEHDLPPIDAGMPGGEFWFLPTGNESTGEVYLPVPKVLHWLLDLLGEPSLETLRDALGSARLREMEGGNDAVVRTLRNWLSGGIPKSDSKIGEIFSDDAKLVFSGAFELDVEDSPEAQFDSALTFVLNRKLGITQLSNQIPMTPERLLPIFEKTASEEEKSTFVRHVGSRYAAPSMANIRQRLRVARLTQAGYQDLVGFLCPELKPEEANDPQRNKVLQLIALFETIYNKTIQAWHHGHSEAEQDAWFEKQFAPWDRYDLLLAIMSSINWEDRVRLLAERLTRLFFSLDPEQELESILPVSAEDLAAVLRPRLERIQIEFDEDKRAQALCQRVKGSSPYRALQSEANFFVLERFAQSNGLSEKIRQMAWNRMAEVASNALDRGTLRLIEFNNLLNGNPSAWPSDICSIVKEKLAAAEEDKEAWEQWKAPFLRFKAKHALFENRFDDAEKLFKSALAACSERAFGGLRGEIARDGFAVSITRSALNRKNHEPYYRNMVHFIEFENGVPSFEDAATEVEEFFWGTLYHPYPGLDSLADASRKGLYSAFKDTFGLIEKADWDGFNRWLSKNGNCLRHSDFKDVRRSSALMQSLKWLYEFEDKLPSLRAMTPSELQGEIFKIEQHLRNRRHSIRLLLDAWPEQAKLVDFKGQTPLMMAANHADFHLVELLLPLSEIDVQDYLGRTSLHAAVAGRSLDCLAAVLALNPDVMRVSHGEENTAAHTAVRFGWVDGLRLLLDEFPGLVGVRNVFGHTPIVMAKELLENHESWRTFMREQKARAIGTRSDFERIVELLGVYDSESANGHLAV